MEMSTKQICAVCFDKFGKKSSKTQKITPAVENKIKMYVWGQFDLSIANQPKVVCNGCHRNLYSLDKNKTEYLTKWMDKISKVKSWKASMCIDKYF